MTLLVVTAVQAEADAVTTALTPGTEVAVEPVGVGPAAAAAGTARLLALAEASGSPYAGVVCAGIAGGLSGRCAVGETVLGARSIAADLGADSGDGFLSLDRLGFGSTVVDADPVLLDRLRGALPDTPVGAILTVSTVTGTAASAAAIAARHPEALAEAMEGYGVGLAARAAGVPFVELRTISNPVGPRDRDRWRIDAALAALTAAAASLATVVA